MNDMTHDEAKRLADLIRSPDSRQKITEREWHAIADILRKHKRPAQPPLLYDRDHNATRVQRAQHYAAYHVLDWQKFYREQHNCKRVPGTETTAMLDDAINLAVWFFGINPQLISRSAILTVVKNRRPSVSYLHLTFRPLKTRYLALRVNKEVNLTRKGISYLLRRK